MPHPVPARRIVSAISMLLAVLIGGCEATPAARLTTRDVRAAP